jgi:hypothetical protein
MTRLENKAKLELLEIIFIMKRKSWNNTYITKFYVSRFKLAYVKILRLTHVIKDKLMK